MTEHEDDIAQLFAQAGVPAPREEFADGVRRAIRRERLRLKLLGVASVAAFVAVVTLAALFIPFGTLYPIRLAQEFLASGTGMLACAACAVGLTAWLRFADT